MGVDWTIGTISRVLRARLTECRLCGPALRSAQNEDLPLHGLKRGDLGTVVEVYASDAIEVEFGTASGRTQALVTLPPSKFIGRRFGRQKSALSRLIWSKERRRSAIWPPIGGCEVVLNLNDCVTLRPFNP